MISSFTFMDTLRDLILRVPATAINPDILSEALFKPLITVYENIAHF